MEQPDGTFSNVRLEFPNSPTNLFTTLEPRDQEIGEFYEVEERRATDFEVPKLLKGSSSRGSEFLNCIQIVD